MIDEKAELLLDDCFAHGRNSLRHADAIEILKSRLPVIAKKEMVTLGAANGRVLAEPVISPFNIPTRDNSAVDGYAFNFEDYLSSSGNFVIGERITAGDISDHKVRPGNAARIFTGAPMPGGADSVVMQEDCTADSFTVSMPKGLKQGANVRPLGEDVKAGETVVQAGKRLRPQEIAAIASIGQDKVCVYERLRVTLFSSGNELVRPGEMAEPGQVYNSNHFMISALAAALPVEIIDGGLLPDHPKTVETALLDAARNSDVILTSGGASLGEEDYMISTLDRHGFRYMWQLAIKPGRPMTFGNLGNTAFFGLPGNPVASFICFLIYVRPSLRKLGGGNWVDPIRYYLPANFEIPSKKTNRREFYRVKLNHETSGQPVLDKFPNDGSGLISSLRFADGLAEIPESVSKITYGDPVAFIPFSQFGIPQ